MSQLVKHFIVSFCLQLLYFSIDHGFLNGFFRALSVAADKHMPRPKPVDADPTKAELETMKEVRIGQILPFQPILSTLPFY